MEPLLFSLLETVTPEKIAGWVNFGFSAMLALAGLILIHEFGHFITARMVGVRVEKFSIGFGPKVYGRIVGDTEYMLCWIPLGGYVKFFGDDPDSDDVDSEESFLNQPVIKRLAIVVAGPLFNLALAIIIVSCAAMIGIPEGTKTIASVMPDSPALRGGLLVGDTVKAIDDKKVEKWGEIVSIVRASSGKELHILVDRADGTSTTLTVVPEPISGVVNEDGKSKKTSFGRVGLMPQEKIVSYGPVSAFVYGLKWTGNMIEMTIWSISKLISRDIPADQIAGPIGIMQMAGKVAETGLVSLMLFISLISVNLGILNLLPVPVLDGGHIVFFSIEALLGRPLKMKTQEMAQQLGIFLLLSLMAFAFYNDIARIVNS